MSYAATRRLIVAAGLGVLLLIALVLYVRRVDTVEVLAVLLFIPVFVAFIAWDLIGGLIAGILAAVAYALLRTPAIDAIGASSFTGIIVWRAVGYLAFGLLGGWADRQLEQSLEKLDVYDQIDDETGLFNARFFLQDTDLEMGRAERYKTIFSVCEVEFPLAALDTLSRRRRSVLLTDVGHRLREAVRSVDRVVHARDEDAHRFAVICPETSREGAAIFTDRLATQLVSFLGTRAVTIEPGAIVGRSFTFPGDDDGLRALRAEFARIDADEHPEHPRPAAAEAERTVS